MFDDIYGPMPGARRRSQMTSNPSYGPPPAAQTQPVGTPAGTLPLDPAAVDPRQTAMQRAVTPPYTRRPYPAGPYEEGGVRGPRRGPIEVPGQQSDTPAGGPTAPPPFVPNSGSIVPNSGSILSLLRGGYANTPEGLQKAFAEHPELGQAGVKLFRAESGKIQLPNGQIVDLGKSFGTGGGLDPGWTQWLVDDGGGSAAPNGMAGMPQAPGLFDFTSGALNPLTQGAQASPLTQQVLQYLAMQLGLGNALTGR